MNQDRRLFEREPVIVEIKPQEKLPGKIYRLLDISKGGFQLETDQFMAEGEDFDFAFSLADGKTSYRLCGKVVWVQQKSSSPERYCIGFALHTDLDRLPELFALPLNNKEQARLG